MYYCYNCDEMFSKPIRIIERHGWTYPHAYEELMVCPFCESDDIEKYCYPPYEESEECHFYENNYMDERDDEE